MQGLLRDTEEIITNLLERPLIVPVPGQAPALLYLGIWEIALCSLTANTSVWTQTLVFTQCWGAKGFHFPHFHSSHITCFQFKYWFFVHSIGGSYKTILMGQPTSQIFWCDISQFWPTEGNLVILKLNQSCSYYYHKSTQQGNRLNS